jgi:hypothetical protein
LAEFAKVIEKLSVTNAYTPLEVYTSCKNGLVMAENVKIVQEQFVANLELSL